MPTENDSFMDDFEEDWEDPLLDISTPYKSFAPLELGCLKLDEDLQDLISFFSRISRKEYIRRMRETAFETNLRVLKNALLVEPRKYDTRLYSKSGPVILNDLDKIRRKNAIKQTDSIIEDRNDQSNSSENENMNSSESELLENNINENIKYIVGGKVTGPSEYDLSLLRNASKNGKLTDHSEHLMVFFRELEAAQLFDNLEVFSGILSAHSIHLRIVQEIVSDMFKVEELRLRLCSQLSALINPIIFSRLISYNNSLFCTAFTIPKIGNSNSKESNSELCSIPDPRQYQWPSDTHSIEDYKLCMSKLPLICFSEKSDLWSCIKKSFLKTKGGSSTESNENGGYEFSSDDCPVRIKSLDFIFTEDFYKSQMDQPLFVMDERIDDRNQNNSNFHHPLCMDIAQDLKDIERDVIYVNGEEYNGATDGYETIVFTVATLIENYWLVNFKLTDEIPPDDGYIDVTETTEFKNKFVDDNVGQSKKCEKYEGRNSNSVLISIVLLHILSRTYSGGACFDKVSLVYNNPECIVISPYSKRARPLELVILPNIALMLSTLRFRLYEVVNNLTANTMPCFLVDTHVVSRLVPNLEFINSLSFYSLHILSRTPVNKIPASIFFHLVKIANKFVTSNVLFTKLKVEIKENLEDNQAEVKDNSHETDKDHVEPRETLTIEHQNNSFAELLDVNIGVTSGENNSHNSNCIDTERIIEVTGDDLTIITPGEAALFKMFTNIQEKDLTGLNADCIQKNIEDSTGSKNGDQNGTVQTEGRGDSKRSSVSAYFNNCSSKEEHDKTEDEKASFELSEKLPEVSSSNEINNFECIFEDNDNMNLYTSNIELKDDLSPNDSAIRISIEQKSPNIYGKSVKGILSPEDPIRRSEEESDEFESKENNEQQSVVLDNDVLNRKAPMLFLNHDICNLQGNCFVNSNIYIASSQNTPDLANDLQNLPSDSIGAIDVENQQYALFLQSKRVVTQFGIFNIINA
ncbi:hypothetical protein FG386_003260 [Cryptosporidium ryanae]|uniref:uncharacterized protein n=1 Tax=Cryptosporidium ryanae TaxID=515981 RepID=UPI00351A4009|nr:hypothetical protein FG386_003260 [Cryptosporidium ryanae]